MIYDEIKVGDIVHKGEEIANLEAMKMENAINAPFEAQIAEVCFSLNDTVQEGQLLYVLEEVKEIAKPIVEPHA